ncbi:MAG: acyl-CoA thioesterase domain-containing protein [Actinomycetota bacterium]
MTDPYFRSTAGGLAPLAHARAPWGDDMLHGRLLGAIAARALEGAFGEPGRRAARLTVDLFRPAPMAPVVASVRTLRQGRRITVGEANLECDGHEVVRATAVFLAESENPPGNIWRPERESWPDPDDVDAPPDGGSPGQTAWWFRPVSGGFGVDDDGGQRGRVWSNETAELVEGEPLTPFVRAALSGDIACPLANNSDQGLHYINADYTMMIARYPVGEWVGIEVDQQLHSDGISMGSSTLVDQLGPFATSGGVSLARPPLVMDNDPVAPTPAS